MIKNYLKIAFRTIKRNKLYSLLNVLGLSVGLASFMIIFFFVRNEMSYDHYHTNSNRIYRVIQEGYENNGTWRGGVTAALANPAAEAIPEIEAFSRMERWNKTVQIPDYRDTTVSPKNISVDKGFFELFDIDLLLGGIPDFDEKPNSVLISEDFSKRYFKGDALGKALKIKNVLYSIEAVYQDFPNNSTIQGELILPFETANQLRKSSFTSFYESYFDELFLKVSEDSNLDLINRKLFDIYRLNSPERAEHYAMALQPLTEMHFALNVDDERGGKTDKQYIYIFSGVAFFILLCSFLNYVSLAVVQSFERTKEIGVRKVFGASKRAVYGQFLAESAIMVLLSLVVSMIIFEALIPQLELLIERDLATSVKSSPILWLQGIGFVLVITLLAALYPAVLSSSSKVSQLLKKSTNRFKPLQWINAFTVIQLIVFFTLVSVGFVSSKQLRFMQSESLGFDKENILYLQAFGNKLNEVLKNEFLEIPNVESVAMTRSIPSRIMGTMSFRDFPDVNVHSFPIGSDYFETMGMEVVSGRAFEEIDLGTPKMMINEAGAKALGIEGDPVGQTLNTFNRDWTIIGVVNDFHFLSKKEPIETIMFRQLEKDQGAMLVRIKGEDIIGTVNAIKSKYGELADSELIYSFLDESIDAQYKQEKLMINMINAATVMAAIVGLLGLFGIAGYSTKRRMKEMGIRKVLGAGFINIQKTLNIGNIKKLILASLISIPLMYYWGNEWLSLFAYRIEFPVWALIFILLMAIAVVLSSALFHSIKAYLINPVEILKDE